MKDLFEYSTPELVRMLGTRFKEYRMRCNLTQKEVSELSGVGLTTIHKFEKWYGRQSFIVNIYSLVEGGRSD